MAAKTDWVTLFLAIGAGIVLGVVTAVGGVAMGLPTAAVAPLTGAFVAGAVPVIYHLRSKR